MNNKVEIEIPHDKIRDAQTITQVQRKAYKDAGVDMSKNDVVGLEDDFKKGKRTITVKGNRKYFNVGRVPWKE